MSWPIEITVGVRVFYGCSSPDTGIVTKISKNRRWVWVKWDCNGLKRNEMKNLFPVVNALTEWVVRRSGERPCTRCGYSNDVKRSRLCRNCLHSDGIIVMSDGRRIKFKKATP